MLLIRGKEATQQSQASQQKVLLMPQLRC